MEETKSGGRRNWKELEMEWKHSQLHPNAFPVQFYSTIFIADRAQKWVSALDK